MSFHYINTEINSPSRLDLSKFLEWDEAQGGFDPLTSYFLDKISELPKVGKFLILEHEKRPDNISYEIYGTDQFWWMLMFYNGVYNNEALLRGMELAYPSLGSIENLYFQLRSLARGSE